MLRFLYIMVGIILGAAAISSDYSNWTLIEAHKLPSFGFILINLIALSLATGIILWACIGRHRECWITDDGIHIRLLSLTSWRKTYYVKAGDIRELTSESYDGRRLVSPKSFDKARFELDWLQIESQMCGARSEIDPPAEASRAKGFPGKNRCFQAIIP